MQILSAEEAYARLAGALRSRSYRFPRKTEAATFRDGAIFPKLAPRFVVPASGKVFTIGSCFARSIENILASHGADVPVARFTIAEGELPHDGPHLLNEYNAGTILQRLENVAGTFRYDDDMGVEETPEGWLDLFLHIHARPVTRGRLLERRRQIEALYRELPTADTIIVTLGLIECWYDNRFGCYLNKAPSKKLVGAEPNRFSFHRLGVSDVVERMSRALALLSNEGGRNVLLTVSPIPVEATFSGDDALIANGYSKSVLRVAVEELRRDFPNVDYFPSYEIVQSGGTGVFEEDNVHVSTEIVHHVTRHMIAHYLPVATAADPHTLYRDGVDALYAGDAAKAAAGADRLMREFPAFWYGADLLGHCRAQASDPGAALALAERALAMAPDHWGLIARAAYLAEQCGDTAKAERLLRRAAEISDDPQPADLLAQLLERRALANA